MEPEKSALASFDDFLKIKLIAAKVIACERVAKSEKLLKETLDVGNGVTKTVCSGIAKYYTPEEMVGKTVVMVEISRRAKWPVRSRACSLRRRP